MSYQKLEIFPIAWTPESNWLILLPSRIPDRTEAGLILPESIVVKSNQGICVKIGSSLQQEYLGKEVLFPTNQEYIVHDSDTDQDYYVLHVDHVLLTRVPPKKTEFVRVDKSQGKKEKDVVPKFATLQPTLT